MTHDRLKRSGPAPGISARELVDELATEAADAALLESMARHYDALRLEAGEWRRHAAEISAWNATAGDGISAPD